MFDGLSVFFILTGAAIGLFVGLILSFILYLTISISLVGVFVTIGFLGFFGMFVAALLVY